MAIVTGDRYLESLVKFVEKQAEPLLEGTLVLKLNPVGLHYVQSRLEALAELESLLAGAPVDYLRAYVSDLGDHRALEQLRRILRLLTSLKVISVLPAPVRDPTPLSLLPFGRLKVLELHGCDLSTSAARGLLELRHTLEKIICHNSTDALRHVFASRIAEIKDNPTWKRLSFVSCACNGLVLMDESLQLLPVVETLDLSRNKFSKVDNIRRCTTLKHLDLGFNHLRSIASFRKVSCQIVKLVLRNNALTTLRGIENLKSLEGLDLSYNIISNFSELEVLVGLPSLCSLWLEGNPVCSASWYRAQVFSFIPDPDKLKLDEKNISTREFWKRQFIIASRQKQPASFGFYSPARDEAELEGSINTKRKKASRLASIENEEQSTFAYSDNDSVSCDNEARSKYENTDADEAPEIVDLMMNKIELMKQERSIMWLEEFKEWMNQASEDLVDSDRYSGLIYPGKDNYSKNKKRQMDYGETSTYVSDSVEASMDQSSTNVLNSENLFSDISTNTSLPYLDRVDEAAPKFSTGHLDKSLPFVGRIDSSQGYLKSHHDNGAKPVKARNSHIDIAVPGSQRLGVKSSATALAGIDDIMESRSSSACPGSPPHYQEDILQRRHNLEEEFLQLSTGSYSVASSESDTSYSEDDSVEVGSLISNHLMVDDLSERSVYETSFVLNYEDPNVDKRLDISQSEKSGTYPLYPSSGQTFDNLELKVRESFPQSCNMIPASAYDDEVVHILEHEADWLQKEKSKKKLKKRVISLKEGKGIDIGAGLSSISNGTLDGCADNVQGGQISGGSNFHEMHSRDGSLTASSINASDELSGTKSSALGTDELVLSYFNENIADSGVQETCRQYVHCNCLLEEKSRGDESEVAVLLSSEHKLYVLLLDGRLDGSGTEPRLVGCHRIEDVKEILVGLGLQVVRVYFEREASYLFITRSIDKSRKLLCILDIPKSGATKYGFPLRSLEQVQVTLFDRGICGDSKLNIFQYSMVLFWHNNMEDDQWLSRSLFVLGGHLLVCIEDISQFASASEDTFSPSYFTLDSCCCIVDALELVIETGTSCCVTLALECSMSEFCPSDTADKLEEATLAKENSALASIKWKLKWFSEESLFKFVALVKVIHAAAIAPPLIIRCTS